jgi:hypothetical protein
MTKELESLKKKLASVDRRLQKLHQESRTLQNKIWLLQKRLELEQLIGKESAVVLGYNVRPDLRGKRGTVDKVNLKRAVVTIDGKQWNVPFDFLKTSTDEYELETAVNRGLGIG